MDQSFKNVKKGLIWNSIASLSRYGLQFIGLIFLARLLTPDDYAAIGMLTIFITVAETFVDSGMGGALIRKQNAQRIDYSTMSSFNMVVSVALYIIYFFCAPLVANFYSYPLLCNLLRIYSVLILIKAFSVVPLTCMYKQLKFKELSIIDLVGGVLALGGAICMAIKGYGPYSLLGQFIIRDVFFAISVIIVSKYRIRFGFSLQSFKEQFSFGVNTTLSEVLRTISENMYTNYIGRFFNHTLTGYYTQSYKLSSVPNSFFSSLINNTYFPVLSQESEEKQFIDKISKLNRKTILVIVLLIGFVIPISKEALFLLGDKWVPATSTLQALLIGSIFMCIAYIGRNTLKCMGKTYQMLKIETASFIFSVILLVGCGIFNYGYGIVVYSFVITTILRASIYNIIANRLIGYKTSRWMIELLSVIIPIAILISICLFVGIYCEGVALSLIVKALIYIFGGWLIFMYANRMNLHI